MPDKPQEMVITLEPHPAREYVHGVPIVVIKDQQQIMVLENDKLVRVGYCGVGPGEAINLIRPYPEDFRNAVLAFVQGQLGGESPVFFAPVISQTKKSKRSAKEA